MNRIISFEDFKSSKNVGESPNFNSTTNEGHDEMTNYMFFQNLASIKHYIEEIMSMDKKSIDAMISDGHDWAVDHVATSKDDIEEVAGWLRNSMSNQEGEEEEEEIISMEEPMEPEADDDDDDDEEEEMEYKSEMVYEESEEEESEQ
jgi:hypothetical protein